MIRSLETTDGLSVINGTKNELILSRKMRMYCHSKTAGS